MDLCHSLSDGQTPLSGWKFRSRDHFQPPTSTFSTTSHISLTSKLSTSNSATSNSATSSFRPSKYEWEPAPDWQEPVIFQTLKFANSHYNIAHYNNPNFQPEEWTPEFEDVKQRAGKGSRSAEEQILSSSQLADSDLRTLSANLPNLSLKPAPANIRVIGEHSQRRDLMHIPSQTNAISYVGRKVDMISDPPSKIQSQKFPTTHAATILSGGRRAVSKLYATATTVGLTSPTNFTDASSPLNVFVFCRTVQDDTQPRWRGEFSTAFTSPFDYPTNFMKQSRSVTFRSCSQ
jgi:hypothetical protein